MLSSKKQADANKRAENFLEVSPTDGRSILNITQEKEPLDLTEPFDLNTEEGRPVYPKPGFCIKSKTIHDVKVFINMCHCEDVPKPDEKLMAMKGGDEEDAIRFPLGLGLPRQEKDKAGRECVCFDVVINSEFISVLLKDDVTRGYVLSICIQGIGDKYGIFIREDCCIKLTKPYHGTMQRQFIKSNDTFSLDNLLSIRKADSSVSSPPLIRMLESTSLGDESSAKKTSSDLVTKAESAEINPNPSTANKYPPLTKSKKANRKPKVSLGLFQVLAEGIPVRYVLEAVLPYCLVIGHKQLKVFVSDDRVVITEKMCNYYIDVRLPNPVVSEKCRANFHEGTLIVVMPLALGDCVH